MPEENKVLTYRGRPLMRKDSLLYYGSMADKYIIMMQILQTEPRNGIEVATKVSVQLQRTEQGVRSRDRIIKRTEKDGIYTALDVGSVWLERALSAK